MTLELEITFKQSGPDDLYHRDPGQPAPQQCYIELDLTDGFFTADYDDPEGLPGGVWDNRVLRWDIPCLTADAVSTLLTQLAPLAQRILDGASINWHRARASHSVSLNPDAAAAQQELATILLDPDRHLGRVIERDPRAWSTEEIAALRQALTADSTDSELAQLAARVEAVEVDAACQQDCIRFHQLPEFLADLREELRDSVRDELMGVRAQLDHLTKQRETLIQRLSAWGDSSREIGSWAGLSHTHVGRIARRS